MNKSYIFNEGSDNLFTFVTTLSKEMQTHNKLLPPVIGPSYMNHVGIWSDMFFFFSLINRASRRCLLTISIRPGGFNILLQTSFVLKTNKYKKKIYINILRRCRDCKKNMICLCDGLLINSVTAKWLTNCGYFHIVYLFIDDS